MGSVVSGTSEKKDQLKEKIHDTKEGETCFYITKGLSVIVQTHSLKAILLSILTLHCHLKPTAGCWRDLILPASCSAVSKYFIFPKMPVDVKKTDCIKIAVREENILMIFLI